MNTATIQSIALSRPFDRKYYGDGLSPEEMNPGLIQPLAIRTPSLVPSSGGWIGNTIHGVRITSKPVETPAERHARCQREARERLWLHMYRKPVYLIDTNRDWHPYPSRSYGPLALVCDSASGRDPDVESSTTPRFYFVASRRTGRILYAAHIPDGALEAMVRAIKSGVVLSPSNNRERRLMYEALDVMGHELLCEHAIVINFLAHEAPLVELARDSPRLATDPSPGSEWYWNGGWTMRRPVGAPPADPATPREPTPEELEDTAEWDPGEQYYSHVNYPRS